jgi:hypothetical protein
LGGWPSDVGRWGGATGDNSSDHDLEREEFEKMIGKGVGKRIGGKTAEGS